MLITLILFLIWATVTAILTAKSVDKKAEKKQSIIEKYHI